MAATVLGLLLDRPQAWNGSYIVIALRKLKEKEMTETAAAAKPKRLPPDPVLEKFITRSADITSLRWF